MSMRKAALLDLSEKDRQALFTFSKQIARKFSDDEDLSKFASDIFRTETDESFKVNLKSLAETLEYTGFSPEQVIREFWVRGSKVDKEEKIWEIYANEELKDKVIMTISSKNINQHLILHILFFVMRGTATKKALEKIQKQWVAPLTFMFQLYKTTSRKKGNNTPLARNEPTIARLASCFPHIVCYFLSQGIGKIYIDDGIIEKLAGQRLPRAILTNMFVDIVPRNAVGEKLAMFCRIYHFMLDLKLSAKTSRSLDNIRKDVLTYTEAAMNSTFVDQDVKIFFLNIFGMTRNGVLLPEMEAICAASTALWDHIILSKDLNDYATRVNGMTTKTEINPYPATGEVKSLSALLGPDFALHLATYLFSHSATAIDLPRDMSGLPNLAASVTCITDITEMMDTISFTQNIIFLILLSRVLTASRKPESSTE